MARLAQERQKILLNAVQVKKGVAIAEMAAQLGVSEMTVRRDLRHLEDRGLLVRVHGGAVAAGARFDQRLGSNATAKAKAAKKLADHIPTSGTIYLDGSTTMLNLIGSMRHCMGLQVVTNHVETFRRLSSVNGVETLLLGGRLDKRTDNLVGALTIRSIQALTFDAAFFSAWGLDSTLGPTEVTLEDAEVKNLVAERSQSIFLAVDDSKLGVKTSGNWHSDPERTTLATNLSPRDKKLAPFGTLVSVVL